MTGEVACFGCGGMVPDEDGPTHRYILSAPGCWRLHGETQTLFSDWRARKLATDAYAVQHPGVAGAQSAQSVVVHLVALCLVWEQGVTVQAASQVMPRVIEAWKGRFPWLEPPVHMGGTTVVDVATAAELSVAAENWARSAWDAWTAQHATIRTFLPDLR